MSESRTKGNQTLARGVEILKYVAGSNDGVSITEVAEFVGTHRTIAYRALETLADAALIARGADSKYRGAVGLLALAAGGHAELRQASRELLQNAANEVGVTLALLIAEGRGALSEARAILVCSPRNSHLHVTFQEGSTHLLHQGAAGAALSAMLEPGGVLEKSYTTFGEVEPGMFGVAVPLVLEGSAPAACVLAISQRENIAEEATELLVDVAEKIIQKLRGDDSE